MTELPTWEEATYRCVSEENDTELDRFICDYEPDGYKHKQWREMLVLVIDEAVKEVREREGW